MDREGNWAIVTNNGRDEISSAMVSLADGKELNVSLEWLGATAVPIGLHLTGPAFAENTLFAAAGCIERAADCRGRRPDLAAAVACGKGA